MDELYASGRDDTWADEPTTRPDWKLVGDLLTGVAPGSVLDVGCFDGRFLSTLNSKWRRFGIEIQQAAAEKAKGRGATILGSDFLDIKGSFDAVVAFDVIEHVTDPAAFLRRMADATASGGIIVISTGNTDSLSWRLMKGSYWYCRFPEHISFINPRWCKHQAKDLGLAVEIYRFSRAGGSLPKKLWELGANVLYLMLPALNATGLRPSNGKIGRLAKEGPLWSSSNDHMIVLFRKQPGCAGTN